MARPRKKRYFRSLRQREKDVESARKKATKTMNELIENGVIDSDDKMACEAMYKSMTIMRTAGLHPDLQLKAARQVLEWTKAKPESKSKVTVQTAEDWLEAVTKGESE